MVLPISLVCKYPENLPGGVYSLLLSESPRPKALPPPPPPPPSSAPSSAFAFPPRPITSGPMVPVQLSSQSSYARELEAAAAAAGTSARASLGAPPTYGASPPLHNQSSYDQSYSGTSYEALSAVRPSAPPGIASSRLRGAVTGGGAGDESMGGGVSVSATELTPGDSMAVFAGDDSMASHEARERAEAELAESLLDFLAKLQERDILSADEVKVLQVRTSPH